MTFVSEIQCLAPVGYERFIKRFINPASHNTAADFKITKEN